MRISEPEQTNVTRLCDQLEQRTHHGVSLQLKHQQPFLQQLDFLLEPDFEANRVNVGSLQVVQLCPDRDL
jgi:hypothetical protein